MLIGPRTATVRVREDPFSFVSYVATKVRTWWMKYTYPFSEFGEGVWIHRTCDITRPASKRIRLKEHAYLAPEVWLTVVCLRQEADTKIVLGRRASIGRRSTISAKNYVEIGDNVLFGPSVFIMDHNHEYQDPTVAILDQGVTDGGRIIIERNCWLGYGAVVFCSKGELVIGENSVIGAHSVVTRSIPARSIVAGNPAHIIKSYDPDAHEWRRVREQAVSRLTE